MFRRRLLARAAFGGVLLAGMGIACNSSNPAATAPPAQQYVAAPAPVETGKPLFSPAPYIKPPADDRVEADPIIVPLAHLTVIDQVSVPSQVDGLVAFVGVELAAGEKASGGQDAWTDPRTGKKYRKLKPGMKVTRKQVVALLDEQYAELEKRIAERGLESAKADVDAAEGMIDSVKALMLIAKEAYDKKAGSLQDLKAAEANVRRYAAEKVAKFAAVKKAEGEQDRAALRLNYHTITSPIEGQVSQVLKQPGESIKANETLLEIQNTDRLRVEGYLDLQHAQRVERGMQVSVEPTLLVPPDQTLSVHKSLPITAIGVSNHAQRPLILSGGQDGMVWVWDRGSRPKMVWPHKGAVRSIACTGKSAKESLALTGSEDGLARIWDLNRLSDTPLRELSERQGDQLVTSRHPGGVTAAAFSPTGEYLVTADGERNIYLWRTATGERVYRFPQEHTSPVSALHFTPQCRVISVGRDNVVHVWQAGETGAAVERSIEHRSGDVPNLGVTDDGNWMVVDHDKSRLHLIHNKEGITERVLQSYGESTQFSTFALPSPAMGQDGTRLLLTASNQGRLLQIWQRDLKDDRTRELRRLVTHGYVPATVAAFSPYTENGFIVVGTERGDVHLWPLPTEEDMARRWNATVTFKDETVEPTGRSVKVWAELANDADPRHRLQANTTAAMVIRPKK